MCHVIRFHLSESENRENQGSRHLPLGSTGPQSFIARDDLGVRDLGRVPQGVPYAPCGFGWVTWWCSAGRWAGPGWAGLREMCPHRKTSSRQSSLHVGSLSKSQQVRSGRGKQDLRPRERLQCTAMCNVISSKPLSLLDSGARSVKTTAPHLSAHVRSAPEAI